MKQRLITFVLAASALGALSLALAVAQSTPEPNAKSQRPTTKRITQTAINPDQAYKANCTRCHAEVPLVVTRRTQTILRHMRVRANLTKDEAQAIIEYLSQ